MTRRPPCIVVAVLLLGAVTLISNGQQAQAAIVTTDFSGVLTGQFGAIPSRFSGIFSVGDAFTGRYIYDTNLPAGIFVPPGTTFYDGFTEFSVTINSFSWTASTAAGEVSNNQGGVDAFGVRTGNTVGPFAVATGPIVAGTTLGEFQLQFRDELALAFDSMALPTSVLSLSDFTNAFVTFDFRDVIGFPVWGAIESVSGTVTASPPPPPSVPEPATLALLALGLVGLVLSRRGHKSVQA